MLSISFLRKSLQNIFIIKISLVSIKNITRKYLLKLSNNIIKVEEYILERKNFIADSSILLIDIINSFIEDLYLLIINQLSAISKVYFL